MGYRGRGSQSLWCLGRVYWGWRHARPWRCHAHYLIGNLVRFLLVRITGLAEYPFSLQIRYGTDQSNCRTIPPGTRPGRHTRCTLSTIGRLLCRLRSLRVRTAAMIFTLPGVRRTAHSYNLYYFTLL